MKKKILIIIAIILVLALIIGTMYIIDRKRMENNKPVVFSTWGYKYAPAESEEGNKIDEENSLAETNGDLDFELLVEITKDIKANKILNNTELDKDNENYDLYYYGLSEVNVKINDKILSLEDALKSGKITLEEIIAKASEDVHSGKIGWNGYYDGGTKEYYYDKYTIIKKQTVEGNKDIWIGVPEMTLRELNGITN